MKHIVEWFAQIYAYFASVPFLSFLLFWSVLYFIYRDKRKATRTSMDITNFLLIGCVSVMYDSQFHAHFKGFWVILLAMLITAGLIGGAQNRLKGRINAFKIIRAVWRLSFLFLSFIYLVFLITGIIKSIFAT